MHFLYGFIAGDIVGCALTWLYAARAIRDFKDAYTLLEAKFVAYRHASNQGAKKALF